MVKVFIKIRKVLPIRVVGKNETLALPVKFVTNKSRLHQGSLTFDVTSLDEKKKDHYWQVDDLGYGEWDPSTKYWTLSKIDDPKEYDKALVDFADLEENQGDLLH